MIVEPRHCAPNRGSGSVTVEAGKAPLLMLAIMVASGCGGVSGRLSREQYAAKADAICRKYQRHARATPSNLSEVVTTLDKALPLLAKALDEVRGLKPPKDEQATADEWLRQSDKVKDALEELRTKAKANDSEGARAASAKLTRLDTRTGELATQLGMTVCNR